ncbi:hypothetical protein HCC61_11275 [Streptomyces sp. HNM0575]|uniref:DUF6397 family protein n=1 Tax=Streptomyces sp. HNM0575 TaxID=2716338 RepID=UPI00145F4BBF|nr:DUF6397 family protein [Streptomyces sp. HNM0575]NLU73253.1 hypothetical protein [Streptomyces sp. HNM0575]
MTDDVAMSTAAKELGLTPGAMDLAAQLGEVHTVRAVSAAAPASGTLPAAGSAPPGGRGARRVPRGELARLRSAEDFPDGLRTRLRVVNGRGGAQLLGITMSRFSRLARAGCFSPVRLYVNRYRTVVWLYLAAELLAFAAKRPALLSGRLPRGLRVPLAEGMDLRGRHWRGRRVGQLCRQADGPWEAAAARAAVLGEAVLEQAVPDAGERRRLSALRPELLPLAGKPAAVREVAGELCTAVPEDEIFWQRLMLAADLEYARASERGSASAATAEAAAPDRQDDPTGEDLPAHGLLLGRPHASWPERPAGRRSYEGGVLGRDRARALQQRTRVLAMLRAPRQSTARQCPPADGAGDRSPGRDRGRSLDRDGRLSHPPF